MTDESTLLSELEEAAYANMHGGRDCQVCAALEGLSDQGRSAVEQALAGTIGGRKLAEILTRNGHPTGVRAIRRHREEGHTA